MACGFTEDFLLRARIFLPVSEKPFYAFKGCCHDHQSSAWNLDIRTTLFELYARNGSAKFNEIWPGG